MVDDGTIDDDIRQAFPVDGTAPVPQAKLTCMRELHHHYMQFFVSPTESLKLGDWSVSERIATIEKEWNRYEEARVNDTNPELPATAEEFRDWFEMVAEIHEYHDVCDYLRNEASLLDIGLLVNAEGKVENWIAEAGHVRLMQDEGWTRNTLKEGDVVTFYYHPAKNGSHSVDLVKVVLPDGRSLWAHSSHDGVPTDK